MRSQFPKRRAREWGSRVRAVLGRPVEVTVLAAVMTIATVTPTLAANPQPQADVLILGSTVAPDPSTGISPEQLAAQNAGLTVEVADDADWAGKTAADFSAYKAIVMGDPTCSTLDASPVAPAVSNEATWGPDVTGNVVLLGADPSFHVVFDGNSSAEQLIQNSIQFAASDPGHTGAYISLSCYYAFANANTPVPLLNALGPNAFTVEGDTQGQCFNSAHIVAASPALSGLNDANLSNWNCSVAETFQQFSPAFSVLAVALDTPNGSFLANDPNAGSPFILGFTAGPSAGATPELDSLLLFGSGLAGVAGYLRLRRRAGPGQGG